ncbi:MAG: lipid-A-disaccharide synthase, partial [Calditrichaeota bacterium]|nr:lipid-A-disaccharide synthase [Calditrichota bacterium]
FTYDLITYCDMAFVASGTATLETACLETPLVVIYRTNPLTYLIAKALVKLPYISLVNIVAGKQIVPELIQNDLTAENLSAKYNYLISYREQIVANLKQVKAKLAAKNVSLEVAKFILSKLNIAGTN